MIAMIDRIKHLIKPVLEDEDVELVEMVYRKEAGRQLLRLLVDKEGGIKLSDCVRLNERVGELLDENNIITESYVVEVDSPGLDRPFKTKRDYERAKGRMVRVTLRDAILDRKEYIGILEDIGDDFIKIDIKKKGVIEIPFGNIVRARQEY